MSERFSRIGIDIGSMVAFVMMESEPIDQRLRLDVAPPRGVTEMKDWFFSARVPISALGDPESNAGQQTLIEILESVKSVFATSQKQCINCNQVTDHRYVHTFPDAQGRWAILQCLDCGTLSWWYET